MTECTTLSRRTMPHWLRFLRSRLKSVGWSRHHCVFFVCFFWMSYETLDRGGLPVYCDGLLWGRRPLQEDQLSERSAVLRTTGKSLTLCDNRMDLVDTVRWTELILFHVFVLLFKLTHDVDRMLILYNVPFAVFSLFLCRSWIGLCRFAWHWSMYTTGRSSTGTSSRRCGLAHNKISLLITRRRHIHTSFHPVCSEHIFDQRWDCAARRLWDCEGVEQVSKILSE